MTHERMAPLMGLAMGAMVPLMVHGQMAGAGAALVGAHILLGLSALALLLFVPPARAFVARHRLTWNIAGRMALGAVAGFTLICLHCLVTWHGTV